MLAALPQRYALWRSLNGMRDVGARAEIYRLIARLAEAGTAVLIVSSEFEELEICDRVAVMREGRLTHLLSREEASEDRLTALCYANEEER